VPPILVNPAAQERNLSMKVDPAPPADATLLDHTAVVRLDVIVGRDGRVQTAKVISGPPAFADAARNALLQWVYNPTLSNGEPVEVRTEVDVTFFPSTLSGATATRQGK